MAGTQRRQPQKTPGQNAILASFPEPDRNIEAQMLACCLKSGKSFGLWRDGFRIELHRQIFHAIQEAEEAHSGTPGEFSLTVLQHLRRLYPDIERPAYVIAQAMEAALPFIPGDVPQYTQHVCQAEFLEYYKRFLLFETLSGGLGEIKTLSPETIISEIDERLQEIRAYTVDDDELLISAQDAMLKAFDDLERERRTICLGIPCVDRALEGGVEPGSLTVIGARPSVGKTAFALSCVWATLHRHKHLFFSLEMTNEAIMNRLLTMATGIPYRQLGPTLKKEPQKSQLILEAAANIARAPLTLFAKNKLRYTLTDIEQVTEKLMPDIVWIDYLQLMENVEPGKQFSTREREIAYYSRFFKNLATNYGIAVVLLCQFSRAVHDTEVPQMQHIRESGAIEQDADVIIGLWHKIRKEGEKIVAREKRGIVLKNRNGRKISIQGLGWIGEKMQFVSMDDQYEQGKQQTPF